MTRGRRRNIPIAFADIEAAKNKLTPRQRAVLVARANGDDYRKIGVDHNLSIGTVKSLIHRGRAIIKGMSGDAP
jgi:DNA-directed RNA polymerase specialized sigma24 family protein